MVGQFLNQATLNKLSIGLIDDNTYQTSRLFACSGPDKRHYKVCNPFGSGLWSKGHNFNKLGRGPLAYAIYQTSKL